METERSLRIDARGMKCPRPVVELAKARRQSPPGSVIAIVADDLAFESDVRAWCETTGNRLVDLQRDGDTIEATIRLAGGESE